MEPEKIGELYLQRKTDQGEYLDQIRTMQAVMDGEITLPLPEISQDEKPAVANLLNQGMHQISRRVASVMPAHRWPSIDPAIDDANKRATDRQRLMTHWHHENKMKRRLGQRARYFFAYATAPILIKPNPATKTPRWIVKDPLLTYPGSDEFDDYLPEDCIFQTTYTYGDLCNLFGHELAHQFVGSVHKTSAWDYQDDAANRDIKFEVLEYIDAYEDHVVLLGHPETPGYPSTDAAGSAVTILCEPNLTGRPLVIIPGSINLSKQQGHFDQIIGMYQTQAALMALTVIAQRRAVWPREWAIANPGETFEVITTPDPNSGTPGEIRGGKIERQNIDPSFQVLELMDRMEYGQRQGAAIPAEFGGMSGTNIRTGRRGAQVMSASIDFTIAEAQDIFADSLLEEDKAAIAIDKAYYKGRKSVFITTRGYSGKLEYAPSKLWEIDKHIVEYPIAGTDLQNLPIEGGQRVAMQTMSRYRFMEIDPVIADPDSEVQRIQREGVESAFLTSIQTLAAAPEGPYQPIHLARLDQKLASGMELYDAVTELQAEIQKEQATAAENAAAEQPGLSMPGQGVEAPPAIPEGEPSMQNLTALLGQLGTAQTASRYRPVG